MKASSRTHLIRLVYWLGALADAAATAAMLRPAETLSVPQSQLTSVTRSAFAAGASLMLGWTCVLIWASAEPIAREASCSSPRFQ